MAFKPKPPTHKIKAKAPDGMDNVVGVAWLNPGGSFSISLRPGTVLRWDDGLKLTAFPLKEKDKT